MNIKELLPEVKENVSLAEHTTFKIGGEAKYFFVAQNKEDIIRAVKAAKQLKLPFFILAGGSNVLFSDNGFNGLIIKIEVSGFKFQVTGVYAEAGVKLADIVRLAADYALSGLEWAAGIYGTVGGAVRGNAGAFGSSISDVVKKVTAFDVQKGKIREFLNKECQLEYRNSIFKRNNNLIVFSAEFQLQKGNKDEIEREMEEHKIYRKEHHLLEFPSAGSVFKNPSGKHLPSGLAQEGEVSAGFLIEQAGLKGKRIGDAQISEKHCNFIVNLGKAGAKDVLELINLIKKEVKNKFRIELEQEIVVVDKNFT